MIKDLSKLPKRSISVNELLQSDDLAELKEWIDTETPNIKEAIIIASLEGGNIGWFTTGLPVSRILYLMETVKFAIMNEE